MRAFAEAGAAVEGCGSVGEDGAMARAGVAAAAAGVRRGESERAVRKAKKAFKSLNLLPETAAGLLEAFAGNEAELLRVLDAYGEVKDLVAQLGLLQTADELMSDWVGREEELVEVLRAEVKAMTAVDYGGEGDGGGDGIEGAETPEDETPDASDRGEDDGDGEGDVNPFATVLALRRGLDRASASSRSGGIDDAPAARTSEDVRKRDGANPGEEVDALIADAMDAAREVLDASVEEGRRGSDREMEDARGWFRSLERRLSEEEEEEAREGPRRDEPAAVGSDDESASEEARSDEAAADEDGSPDERDAGASAVATAIDAEDPDVPRTLFVALESPRSMLRREVQALAEATGASKTADQLLEAYGGRENELLDHLKRMKICNDVKSLAATTDVSKTADQLLEEYFDREDELLAFLHVRALIQGGLPRETAENLLDAYKGREDEMVEFLRLHDEVRELTKVLRLDRSADEMLANFEGREEELLEKLREMKAEVDADERLREEVGGCVERLGLPKTAEQLLVEYRGRETELIANLQTMEAQTATEVGLQEKIRSLAGDLALPKTTDQLLEEYRGRERELFDNLRIATVERLVGVLRLEKSTDEILADHAGREDELLDELKAKEAARVEKAGAKVRDKIRTLAADLDLPMNADQLLASYEGREGELLGNLQIMTVERAVEELGLEQTVDELLAANAWREDELLKELKAAKAERAAKVKEEEEGETADVIQEGPLGKIRALATYLALPVPLENLLATYEGREEELLGNLQIMTVERAVDVLGLEQSVDDLLADYQGNEDELLEKLRTMKADRSEGADLEVMEEEKTAEADVCVSSAIEKNVDAGAEDDGVSRLPSYKGLSMRVVSYLHVRVLVREGMSQDVANKLLGAYAGREDELADCLRLWQRVNLLVTELSLTRTPNDMLAEFLGREEELVEDLLEMKAKAEENALLKFRARELASRVPLPKTADQMLAEYEGREDELIENLRTMVSHLHGKISALVEDLALPKTADQLLAEYEGRQAELLGNLQIMAVERAVASLELSKTADELLAAFVGREDELLENLRTMEAERARNSGTAKPETKADAASSACLPEKESNLTPDESPSVRDEVSRLVAATGVSRSVDQLLQAYSGREDQLLGCLRLHREVQRLPSVLGMPKTSKDLLEEYRGREHELLEFLRERKAEAGVKVEMEELDACHLRPDSPQRAPSTALAAATVSVARRVAAMNQQDNGGKQEASAQDASASNSLIRSTLSSKVAEFSKKLAAEKKGAATKDDGKVVAASTDDRHSSTTNDYKLALSLKMAYISKMLESDWAEALEAPLSATPPEVAPSEARTNLITNGGNVTISDVLPVTEGTDGAAASASEKVTSSRSIATSQVTALPKKVASEKEGACEEQKFYSVQSPLRHSTGAVKGGEVIEERTDLDTPRGSRDAAKLENADEKTGSPNLVTIPSTAASRVAGWEGRVNL
ncbi:hypothetical protein ACHAWF_014695 [Thalassiosira exigua]